MRTIVLAFDIERTGALPENETIAIGISVVDDKFQQLDSVLLKGYVPRPIPSQDDGPVAPRGFELRSWVEFWVDKQHILPQLATDCNDFDEAQLSMITSFQEFRKKWELRADEEGFNLEICSDNPVFDCTYINSMIAKYLPHNYPLPYRASAVKYQTMLDTDSMLKGVLASSDRVFNSQYGMSSHVRSLYEVVITTPHDHLPNNDAYNIACDAQIVFGIRKGEILRKECCCCVDCTVYDHWNCSDKILNDMVDTVEKDLEKNGRAIWGGGIVCRHMKHILDKKYICDYSRGSYITITGRK